MMKTKQCPDLVTIIGDKAYIIDITKQYKDRMALQEAVTEKIMEYDSLHKNIFCCRHNLKSFNILPLIFGCRGALPSDSRGSWRTWASLKKR
jgi:hypothetical protein